MIVNVFPIKYRLAVHRASKTAAQAFVGSIVASWISSGRGSVSGLFDTISGNADMAGGTAILAALVALGWNTAHLSGGDRTQTTPTPPDEEVWPR